MVVQRLRPSRVLVFNPNTSVSVTRSLEPILAALSLPNTSLTFWTCPTGPALISSQADMYESAAHCLPHLVALAAEYDGFLGACYADHPIVPLLRSHVGNKPVVGIFDASVLAALQLVGPTPSPSQFGIVTTGPAYETLLADGVRRLLGPADEDRLANFAGVVASGIGMADLQPEAQAAARDKIMTATARLLRASGGAVDVVSMGGVILAGMEAWVHEACERELGPERGAKVRVVDQLLAGMLTLDALLRQKPPHTVDYARALR